MKGAVRGAGGVERDEIKWYSACHTSHL